MTTNTAITVYNRKYDKDGHLDTWHRTVIDRAWVHVDHKSTQGDASLDNAEAYKIRIPRDVENADKYLPPEEYAEAENTSEYWTIQNGDHIVVGVCPIEIEKPADLKRVYKKHCKVLLWADNSYGMLPHWRIEGE